MPANSDFIPNSENSRAAELLVEYQRAIYRQTDRLFALLLPLQWLAAILAAQFISPAAWNLRGENLHLAGAVLVGGIIVSFPLFLVLNYPGETFTRYIVAVSQILISGLLIHLTAGNDTTHFHVFASLIFLSFYRDWKVLAPATAITAVDHFLRGWLFPFSIYGASENTRWLWLEHLGWIVFVDILLIVAIRRAVEKAREIAVHTAELETKEERYRAVVEQIEDGIAIMEIETMRVLDCNPAFLRLIGCESVEAARKLTAYDLNTEKGWREKYKPQVDASAKKYSSGEKNYRRLDGSLVPVEVNASLMNYYGRDVYCVRVKDVTERKDREAELKRLAIVAQKTQNAVIITDAEGCIQWVNDGFTRLTGWEFDEVVGNLGYLLQGENTDKEQIETIRLAMWARKPYSGEIFNYTKDGKGFWMSISITPTFDDNGEMRGFIAVQMDVTERKALEAELIRAHDELERRVIERTAELVRANEAMRVEMNERKRAEIELNEAQQFLLKVIASVPNMIFVKDSQQRYLMANSATAELYGTTVENMVGKTTADFHHHLDEAGQIAFDDAEVLATMQEKFIAEEKITNGRGEARWLQIVKRPLVFGDGKARYILGVATDLTERKLLENQLRHSQKMESIGQLTAGVAHEINTPTQYVSDNTLFIQESFADISEVLRDYRELLQTAKSGKLDAEKFSAIEEKFVEKDIEYLLEEIPNAVSQSIEGISRISKIVKSMRTLSHPGTIEKEIADLNRAVESTAIIAQNEWKYYADLETRLDENLPAVPCLLDEINQVILNIIVNAAHSIAEAVGDGTRGKGKIVITTSRVEDWAEIRIADTGRGIPPAVQNRVFDPFFTTKEVGKGTGQGLAISHNVVVKKHNGQLTFETEPERGTTFIIRLPLATEQISALVV